MRWRLLCFLVLSGVTGLLLGGCASFDGYPEPPFNPDAQLGAMQAYFGPDIIQRYESTSDETDRRRMRDSVVYGQMRAYDLTFEKFERVLSGGSNGIAAGSDLAVLALNGLGATTGSAELKAALAAASAGVIGAKGAINKDFFYEKTIPVLLAQIEANRAKAKLLIFDGLRQSDADYPLTRALLDLDNLRAASGIPQAISGIAQTANDQRQRAQLASFLEDDSSQHIQSWLGPAGARDRAHLSQLQAWLKARAGGSSAAAIALPVFLFNRDQAGARRAAITDLSIP